MGFRGKSIRRKIVALLLVPLLSLTGLWGFATFVTGRQAGHLLKTGQVIEEIGLPMAETARLVQRERRQSLLYLADPRTADALDALHRDRAATDRAVASVRDRARDPRIAEAMHGPAARQFDSLLEAFEGLAALRQSVDTGAVDRLQALEFYNRLVDPCYRFFLHLHVTDDVELEKQGRALVGLGRAHEMLAREDALVVSSLVGDRLTAEEVRLVSDLAARRRQFYELSFEVLPRSERDVYRRYWRSPETQPLRHAEEAVIAAGPAGGPRGVDAVRWEEAASTVLDRLDAENRLAGDRYQERVKPAAYEVLLLAGISGVLGFIAVLCSLVVSVRVGRGLIRDLTRLRKEAQEVSGTRLPSVMRRLAAGEHIDVETEVPRLEYDKDEMGQVGQALNSLQRAAVEAAVKQADMRRGVSEVFVNLARRNQVLLHRQLTLLDAMERRTEDAEELADLFRLDHLTTRMRRHAEGLVILSGAAPSRQWRKPVQLMDVVRAAVAEVEDYERIEVRRLPRIGVAGPAVADLTHLIAELLENATAFSPPHTAAQVHGERVTNGFTLEIHDRGLGMSPEDLLDANLRLAETPEFELSDTDRLGLFVVSRLARRQNVRVSLQPSPYGGTTAVVFIPAALLTDAPETQGAGFRLDRQTPGRGGAEPPARRGALTQVPSVLDGPVELDGPLDFLGDLDDGFGCEGDEAGAAVGLFRSRPPLRPTTDLPVRERRERQDPQDERARDEQAADGRLARPVPLPRRKPALVARHVRLVDEPGTAAGTRRGGDPGAPAPAPDGTAPPLGGLPRRVRQANLAPQLREQTDRPDAPAAPADPRGTERDAEQVRGRMAAMQRGWQRARSETAPGTTPEGDGR
ncbi:nitrate- and nitrite sensing domain-containing protein [Streptomyces somaliensis]|uniref:sensor histidine kinase n=1 Tax=Streptomyces somaliensis TaxID=78355 RepID=UPI0034E932C8|nr:nitrate- and nitrite sensing domain-containing protein [Streptomyces somaliensis]MCP9973082.1 nitrate- and nitrite sensing domain-containing protein [Streptomyces somaliensis]